MVSNGSTMMLRVANAERPTPSQTYKSKLKLEGSPSTLYESPVDTTVPFLRHSVV